MPTPSNPLAKPIAPIAAESLRRLNDEFRLAERCGGAVHVDAAVDRLASMDPDLHTHDDTGESGLQTAADATALALLHTERSRQEHADANANDLAITRARLLLAEALLLLQCAATVNFHADRIEKVRAAAAASAPSTDTVN